MTGYVSNHDLGYVRISPLKRKAVRAEDVFFVSDEVELETYINYLEIVPVLIRRD